MGNLGTAGTTLRSTSDKKGFRHESSLTGNTFATADQPIDFRIRLLETAEDASTPLFDRLENLCHFSERLDQFFMMQQAFAHFTSTQGPLTPEETFTKDQQDTRQLPYAEDNLAENLGPLVTRQFRCWESLRPELVEEGIYILNYSSLTNNQLNNSHGFFREMASPLLTPMAIDSSHPVPSFRNLGIYIAANLKRNHAKGPTEMLGVVELPRSLPRLVPVASDNQQEFLMLEDLIISKLPQLFGGYTIQDWRLLRVTRAVNDPTDIPSDLLLKPSPVDIPHRRSKINRLEVVPNLDHGIFNLLAETERIVLRSTNETPHPNCNVYQVSGPLDLSFLRKLAIRPEANYLPDQLRVGRKSTSADRQLCHQRS